MRDHVLGGHVLHTFLVSPHSPFYFVLSCLLSLCWRSQRMLFCVHVGIQLCTHVYTVVYTRVHCCIHACTLLYTRVYTEAFITTSFRGVCRLYEWALVYSTDGLSSARQKGSCLLGGWTPLSCTEVLVPTLWIAFSLCRGGLLSSSSRLPYK